ncbi:MAG: site-2 protease family protein [Candidatus Altiarchaeota archaeon]|nr:site-2 protease family protein [Candidatus Altiarchaeota archaeon]
MEYWIIFLITFIAGTALLMQTKYERHLKIIFLIRTQHFINAIDFISKIAPRFWLFLVDAALPLFFGGVGFAYLSKQEKSHKNLNILFYFTGFIAAVLISQDIITFLVTLIMLAFGLHSLKKRNTSADFITGSVFITIITLKIFGGLSLLGLQINLPTEYMYLLALIEGMLGVVPLMFIAFIYQAYAIVFEGSQRPGVSPALPDVRDGELGLSFPGTDIFIPVVYALIAIITVLFPHEFAHGIIARVHKLKLKSTGLLTLGILPIGAFVEPDEEEIKNRPSLQKTQIFIAGSFANLLVSLLAVLLLVLIPQVYLSMGSNGVEITGFGSNSSLGDNMAVGEILYTINNHSVKGITSFKEVTSQLMPGDNATLLTNKGSYTVTLTEHPENSSRGYMGILARPYHRIIGYGIIDFITTALFWIWFFNLNICLVNLLPIVPFDGWRILEELAKTFKVNQKEAMKIVKGVVAFSLFLLLLNALPLVTQAINLFIDILSRI